MNRKTLAREALLAVGLIAGGLIALPALVYLVGRSVVGAYADGMAGFYAALGDGLIAGNVFAWILILSPYFCILLIRCFLWLRPPRQTVNQLTNPANDSAPSRGRLLT
jgi:hypothetical protein